LGHLDTEGVEKRQGVAAKGKTCVKWKAQELSLLRAALTKDERPDGKPGLLRPPRTSMCPVRAVRQNWALAV